MQHLPSSSVRNADSALGWLARKWRSYPPEPNLVTLLGAEPDMTPDRWMAIVRFDALERRSRGLAWGLDHYRSALGEVVAPDSPSAELLLSLELDLEGTAPEALKSRLRTLLNDDSYAAQIDRLAARPAEAYAVGSDRIASPDAVDEALRDMVFRWIRRHKIPALISFVLLAIMLLGLVLEEATRKPEFPPLRDLITERSGVRSWYSPHPIAENPRRVPERPGVQSYTLLDPRQLREHIGSVHDPIDLEMIVRTFNDSGLDGVRRSRLSLHLAALEGNAEAVAAIIEDGGDVNAKDSNGRTPLHNASRAPRYSVDPFDLSLTRIDRNAKAIWEMIDRPVVGRVNRSDVTARRLIGRLSYLDMNIVRLIDAGADVNAKDDQGWTALHVAVAEGYPGSVETLIRFGADVNAEDNKGQTALHVAAREGHAMDIPELLDANIAHLIDAGADVNAKDDQGWTALHVAAAEGYPGVVETLITFGADVNAKDDEGWTALHLAAREGHVGTVTALTRSSPLGGSPTDFTDANAKDENGWTPLHEAAAGGHAMAVAALIEAGADVNRSNAIGVTPLHSAAEEGHGDAAASLLGAGADVNAIDDDGRTALHVAARAGQAGVVAALLWAGADLEAKNKDGSIPLQVAVEKGHAEVVEILLRWKEN